MKQKIAEVLGMVIGIPALIALAILGISLLFVLISAIALAIASPIILIAWMVL